MSRAFSLPPLRLSLSLSPRAFFSPYAFEQQGGHAWGSLSSVSQKLTSPRGGGGGGGGELCKPRDIVHELFVREVAAHALVGCERSCAHLGYFESKKETVAWHFLDDHAEFTCPSGEVRRKLQ